MPSNTGARHCGTFGIIYAHQKHPPRVPGNGINILIAHCIVIDFREYFPLNSSEAPCCLSFAYRYRKHGMYIIVVILILNENRETEVQVSKIKTVYINQVPSTSKYTGKLQVTTTATDWIFGDVLM